MAQGEMWASVDPTRYKKWCEQRARIPHLSMESKSIIWPGQMAMRRLIHGIWAPAKEYQWITKKEYTVLVIQGKI